MSRHLKTVSIDVTVDLSDIDTDDLIKELESRPNRTGVDFRELDLRSFFTLRLCGQKEHADRELLEAVWKLIDEEMAA